MQRKKNNLFLRMSLGFKINQQNEVRKALGGLDREATLYHLNTYFNVCSRQLELPKPHDSSFSPWSPIPLLLRSSSCNLCCIRHWLKYWQVSAVSPQPCSRSIFSLQFKLFSPSASSWTPLVLKLLYPRSSSLRNDSFELRTAANAGQLLSVRLENFSLQRGRR